jgi:hypothetical protein
MPVRPKSIVQFDYIYLAIIALGLVGSALSWDELLASVSVQRMVAQMGTAPLYGTILVVTLLQLLLWYFIARRGSVVAKWVFVVYAGASLVFSAYSLAVNGAISAAVGVVSVATLVLQAIAIWLLFRPDTPAWFGEDASPE